MTANPLDPRRCSAKSKQSGVQCKRWAVPGLAVCPMHGGSTPKAKAKAAAVVQEAQAEAVVKKLVWKADAPPVTNAVAGLQQLAGQLVHAAEVLGAELDAADLEPVRAAAWLRILRELRQALAEMERLGIAGKAVEVEAGKVRLMAFALSRVFEVIDLPEAMRDIAISAFFDALRTEAAADVPAVTA